jgi:hypothetical protein
LASCTGALVCDDTQCQDDAGKKETQTPLREAHSAFHWLCSALIKEADYRSARPSTGSRHSASMHQSIVR